jgi:hypothetical protein
MTKLGTTYPMNEYRCLRCRQLLDAATVVDDDCRPEAGDVSICMTCGHVAIFTHAGKLRQPRPAELRKIMCDERIVATRAAVKLLHAERRKH